MGNSLLFGLFDCSVNQVMYSFLSAHYNALVKKSVGIGTEGELKLL